MRTIQTIRGHANLAITERYTQVASEHLLTNFQAAHRRALTEGRAATPAPVAEAAPAPEPTKPAPAPRLEAEPALKRKKAKGSKKEKPLRLLLQLLDE